MNKDPTWMHYCYKRKQIPFSPPNAKMHIQKSAGMCAHGRGGAKVKPRNTGYLEGFATKRKTHPSKQGLSAAMH